MSKNKSQWDFGELFPTETARKVFSVGELTEQIRRLLEKQIGAIWVGGEVTNFRAQSSGHIYFTLRDANAQISCVLFRNEIVPHRELIADGQKFLVQGEVTVYEARGQYQIVVRAVELQGVGAAQIAFEKLKQKLAAEGFFAPERKRALPKFPQRIGLVTSPTGAAIRDVIHVIERRHPGLEIIFAPCRVQGDGAAREIAGAIHLLNELQSKVQSPKSKVATGEVTLDIGAETLDLILITRGGGAAEDLSCFNTEIVARAIFESQLPVVSAVGHEIDFTLADFVADARAATPSAAAEIITQHFFASREFVAEAEIFLRRAAQRGLNSAAEIFLQFNRRLTRLHPRRQLNENLQRLDDLEFELWRGLKTVSRSRSLFFENLADRFLRVKPSQFLKVRRENLRQFEKRLNSLGPEQVLARGYSITTDAASGNVLRDAGKIKPGQKLKTRLAKGEILSRAEKN
jgi:exodeoxyribonuclease VII large subunit